MFVVIHVAVIYSITSSYLSVVISGVTSLTKYIQST